MAELSKREFERVVMVHLDAAYGFAARLVRDRDDAADVVQEACLRAWRFFESFHGGNAKVWLLTIVRNAAYDWLNARRDRRTEPLEDQHLSPLAGDELPDDPEMLLRKVEERAVLDRLVQNLAAEYREVLVLREIEDLSYREIAEIVDVPIGTVMSRLARARRQLQQGWIKLVDHEGGVHGLRR